MDAEISRALAELELTLAELERTVELSVGAVSNAPVHFHSDAPGRRAADLLTEPPLASPDTDAARPVVIPTAPTGPAEPPAAIPVTQAVSHRAAAAPTPGAAIRLVDEAVEASGRVPHSPGSHGSLTTLAAPAPHDPHPHTPPTPAMGPPLTSSAAETPAAALAPAAAPTPASAPARLAATAAHGQAGAQATAAELAGFHDRLARRSPSLAQEYQDLLSRLSFAAVPTPEPTPPKTRSPISFARGAPSLDIVDVQGLKDAAARAFDSDPQGTTAYGTSVGYQRLRAWIADRHGVEPENVIVTNGSMQADAFLFEHLVRPGDEVVVERPTYDRTLLSLRQRGAQLHAIELEQDGLNTDELKQLLESGAKPRLAHIIPNFQNPAGYTISLAKRQALLSLAAKHDFIVFEDDPYVALRFSGESLPTMLSMDPERVVYASSFSKTVCPGIRVGYLVGPAELVKAIADLATGAYISPNMVAQSIVYEFCASGAIDRSIETVRTALAERAATLANALRRDLPDADFFAPQGGYFMWVTLPDGTNVAALHKAAGDLGVAFVKGTDFLLSGGENTLRLAYSGVTPRQIEEGIARLAEAYRSL